VNFKTKENIREVINGPLNDLWWSSWCDGVDRMMTALINFFKSS
jgi:hypothetical protein